MKKNRNAYTFIKNQITPGMKSKNGNGACQPPRKTTVAMHDTRIMFPYSARKKNANRIPLYSVKKPATSSLSASGKSNGNRLVSAMAAMVYSTSATNWGNATLDENGGNPNAYQFQKPPA